MRGFDPPERLLAVLLRAPHRHQAGIPQPSGERVRVVVEVRHVEQIMLRWEPDIESECPQAVDPRASEQRFGVVEVRPQPNLIRVVGPVPLRQRRRDPQLLFVDFGAGVPAHRHKVTRLHLIAWYPGGKNGNGAAA